MDLQGVTTESCTNRFIGTCVWCIYRKDPEDRGGLAGCHYEDRFLREPVHRDNVEIDGVRESAGEIWFDTERLCHEFLANNLGQRSLHIQRAH